MNYRISELKLSESIWLVRIRQCFDQPVEICRWLQDQDSDADGNSDVWHDWGLKGDV